ncbi:MAG: protein translocase subunit SecD [Betaproteobacteria bacterium]|nr:protein translocase subunit SecD [Betaproteobacteria bacterium]
MNRYPLWRYLVIGFALVISVIYTLPNFFGEVPAVQISSLKATARVDTPLMETVEKTLKANSIQLDGMFTDPNSIKVRFRDTDTQLKAKDVLDRALNPDRESPSFILALNLISDSPAWFTAVNALPMYLGLDLRGGIHFLLQVDLKAALNKRLDGQVAYIRNALREKKIPYAGIAREGQAVIVKFRDAETRDKAQREIERVTPDFALKTADDAGEFRIAATLTPQAQSETQKSAIEQNITTLRNRVNELGVAEPIIQQQGADRIVVQLPGVQDTARAKDILGRTATLEIRMVEAHGSDPAARDYDPAKIEAAVKGNIPFGTELFYERRGPTAEPLLVSKQVVITGERLTKAAPTFDQRDQRPVVAIELDGQGARLMRDATRDSIKRRMAVLLIEKGKPEVITAPVIQDVLGGSFQITGSKSPREASDLALLLRAGALAAPMDIIEERTVGPSLGAENIKIGFQSTWIGFAAVSVFMVAYYLLFGLISIVALAINVFFLIALLSMLQATLTLPGMAGIALTIGMAIDANVLINERIREELRNGNTPQAAIHAGYDRAWGTILDSNITTLIAGIMLFLLGSGPVKGFAVVLCLGILTSIFSAVMVSRGIVNLYYGRRRKLESLSIGQVWKPGAEKHEGVKGKR